MSRFASLNLNSDPNQVGAGARRGGHHSSLLIVQRQPQRESGSNSQGAGDLD
jgi:hypothetical protein